MCPGETPFWTMEFPDRPEWRPEHPDREVIEGAQDQMVVQAAARLVNQRERKEM